MKYYTDKRLIAKQVPPELATNQNVDWDFEEMFDLALDGNKDLRSRCCQEYKDVMKLIDNEDGWVFNSDTELYEYINYHLPSLERIPIEDCKDIFRVLHELNVCEINLDTAIVRILGIYTKSEWACTTIKGCTQGDWQKLFYNKSTYDEKEVSKIEADYFNLGTEWEIYQIVDDEEHMIDDIYCYEYSIVKIREELAENLGCKPEDIRMFRFDGFERIPKHKEIE